MADIFKQSNDISGYDLIDVIDNLQRKIYNAIYVNQAIVEGVYDSVTSYNFTGKFITKVGSLSVSITYRFAVAAMPSLGIKVSAQGLETNDGSMCDKLIQVALPMPTDFGQNDQVIAQVENWIAAQADVPTINQLSTIYDLLEQKISFAEILAAEMK